MGTFNPRPKKMKLSKPAYSWARWRYTATSASRSPNSLGTWARPSTSSWDFAVSNTPLDWPRKMASRFKMTSEDMKVLVLATPISMPARM